MEVLNTWLDIEIFVHTLQTKCTRSPYAEHMFWHDSV